jgi:gentisate 1,2-dioxygenase
MGRFTGNPQKGAYGSLQIGEHAAHHRHNVAALRFEYEVFECCWS